MKIWKYPSSAALLINCCWSALDYGLSLNNIAPQYDLKVRSSVYTQEGFSLSLSDAKHNFDELWRLIIWFFLCPQLIRMLFVFLLRVHCIAPGGQPFKEFWEELMSFHVNECSSLFDNLCCSGIKSDISTIMSIQV